MQTSSEGRHSVRISGLSTIDFRAGFSRKLTLDFKKTSSRPVQGQWGPNVNLMSPLTHGTLTQMSSDFVAVYCISYQHCRYSHLHPAEHHWTLPSSSCWQVRAPISHGWSNKNVADPLLPRTAALRPLEHHAVYSTQRGLLPASDRIRPGWLPVPESLQRFLLQHYPWSGFSFTHI